MDKVWKNPKTGCWEWTAGCARVYAHFTVDGKAVKAHRWIWERVNGRRIPAGLQIDHLCAVKHCVNPKHLRLATARENVLAPHSKTITGINASKTHCPQGHEY